MATKRLQIGNGLGAAIGALAVLMVVASTATGQTPSQAPAPAAAGAAAPGSPAKPGAVPVPPAPDTYSYNPEGRRDPFLSLLTRGSEVSTSREAQPEGREGLAIGEVSVRGIIRTRTTIVAMVQGPDNKTYIIHTGDKMLDGAVKAITTDAVVFSQDVNDPLSLIKQREVRKMLRVPEEGK